MSANTSTTVAEAIEAAKQGRSTVLLCPAHGDRSPSLSIGPGEKQPVVIKCHAGCDPQDILDSAGLTMDEVLRPADEFEAEDRRPVWTPAGDTDPSLVYPYRDADGTLLYEVLRTNVTNNDGSRGKRIFQRRPDPESPGRYLWNLDTVKRVPFNLPKVVEAVATGAVVHIAEGEKCVRALERVIPAEDVATCNSGGAGKWLGEFNHYFTPGTQVIVYADADDPGRQHAREVRENLTEAGCMVRTVEPPPGQLRGGKAISDVADHLEAGRTLASLLETTPQSDAEKARTGVDILDLVGRERVAEEFVIDGTLAKGERMLLVGLEGRGKDEDLRNPLPTPTGWTTMGEVRVGDQVIGSNGEPCNVVAKSEVFNHRCMKVTFSDGTETITGLNHQWVTHAQAERQAAASIWRKQREGRPVRLHRVKNHPRVRTTAEIAETIEARPGFTNHSVKVAEAFELPEADLPVAPYAMGAWLGDGATHSGAMAFAHRDLGIRDGIEMDGYRVSALRSPNERNTCSVATVYGLQTALRGAGVLGDKHIPAEYLRASLKQRLALLAGICDSDGYVLQDTGGGRGDGYSKIEVTFMVERLARGLMELLCTLGIQPHLYTGEARIGEKSYGTKYRVQFQSDFNPFRHCSYKAERWSPLRTQRTQHRYIVKVEEVESVPTQCIQVDSPDHTYLTTEAMIPTHNSTLLRQMAVMTAAGLHPFFGTRMDPKRVLFIDAENHPNQVVDSWANLVGLCVRHASPIEAGMLTVLEEWDAERDLTSREGQTWLKERVYGYRPDLLILGPLTNLAERDLSEYEQVNRLRRSINSVRDVCNSAIIMEHHAPLRATGDKIREVRPYGNGLFLKWPDYGYAMVPTDVDGTYEWRANRGPRVRSRRFPDALRQGNQHANSIEFPWEQAAPV